MVTDLPNTPVEPLVDHVLHSRWTPRGVYPVNSPRAGRQQGSMGSGGCAGSPFSDFDVHGSRRRKAHGVVSVPRPSGIAGSARVAAGQLRRPAGQAAPPRPDPRQAVSGAAGPVQRAAVAAGLRKGRLSRRRGHRHPQLRRPARPARTARHLRRAARHPGAQSDRGQQRQPRADARRGGVFAAARRGGFAAAVDCRNSRTALESSSCARCPDTTGTSRSPRASASR